MPVKVNINVQIEIRNMIYYILRPSLSCFTLCFFIYLLYLITQW